MCWFIFILFMCMFMCVCVYVCVYVAIAITKIIKSYGKKSEYGSLPSNGAVFYDLGSGIGKTLIAASVLFNFSICRGIECLEALHRGAEWVLESYNAQVLYTHTHTHTHTHTYTHIHTHTHTHTHTYTHTHTNIHIHTHTHTYTHTHTHT
jgi:hypothetical protein